MRAFKGSSFAKKLLMSVTYDAATASVDHRTIDDDVLSTRTTLQVVTVLSFGLGICFVMGWFITFYMQIPTSQILSASAADSFLPHGISLSPAIGIHYFTDFEAFVLHGRYSTSPYSPHAIFSTAYGPLAIFIAKVCDTIVGWPGAVFLFLSTSAALFIAAVYRLVGRTLPALLLGLLLLFTGPSIISMDRGNFDYLMAGFFVLFCYGLLRDRPLLTIIPLIVVASIKCYTIVLVLILLRERRWKESVLSCGLTLAGYFIGFLAVGGGFFANVRGFLHLNLGNAGATKTPGLALLPFSVSTAGAIYHSISLFAGFQGTLDLINRNPRWYPAVPCIAISVVCVALFLLARREREISLLALFALMQLGPVSNFAYVSMSMVIELCLLTLYLIRTQHQDSVHRCRPTPISPAVIKCCVVMLIFGIVPFSGYGPNLPISQEPLHLWFLQLFSYQYFGSVMNTLVVLILFFCLLRPTSMPIRFFKMLPNRILNPGVVRPS